jgi:predicted nuclease with TOPRIM domain
MRSAGDLETRERLGRWLEDGPAALTAALALVKDCERLQAQLEAAEADQERLRGVVYENEKLRNQLEAAEGECAKLRQALGHLRAETERHQRDREEIAAALSDMVNGLLLRLRGEPART